MKDKDYIEELFSKTLNEHQVKVRPELWNSIQSQVAASSATTTVASIASKSLWVKGFIGLGSVIAISVGTYIYFNPAVAIIEKEHQSTEINQPTKEIKTPSEEVENIDAIKGGNKLTTTTHEKEGNVNAFITSKDKAVDETQIVPQVNLTQSNKEVVKKENDNFEGPISIVQLAKTPLPNKVVQKEKEPVINNENKQVTRNEIKAWDNTNVFTPNGDGVNDLFYLKTGELKEFSIAILDKDNKVVYTSNDPKFKWDGTNYLTGEKVPDGTYSYILYAVDLAGEQTRQFNLLYITK